jgi:hypothetical protein
VNAEAAAALAVLAQSNRKIQDKVAAAEGIKPLVTLLKEERLGTHAKEEAASALWSLATEHYENQVAVADSGGIAPLGTLSARLRSDGARWSLLRGGSTCEDPQAVCALTARVCRRGMCCDVLSVAALGLNSVRAQEQAAGALAALALKNAQNESSIAELIVSLLGSTDKQASAKAARAISRLARAHSSNQSSLARAGGVELLVKVCSPHADRTRPILRTQAEGRLLQDCHPL